MTRRGESFSFLGKTRVRPATANSGARFTTEGPCTPRLTAPVHLATDLGQAQFSAQPGSAVYTPQLGTHRCPLMRDHFQHNFHTLCGLPSVHNVESPATRPTHPQCKFTSN